MEPLAAWMLDPEVIFLNHGSFGSCPWPILEEQRQWQERMERQPVRFFLRDLEEELDTSRAALARFVNADVAGLALVPNATAGVNAVLRSLQFAPGDRLLTTTQEYGASRNALAWVAERAGAEMVAVDVPFPISDPDEVVERVLGAVDDRTRLVLLDHVTSQTGLVWPIETIVAELRRRGVLSLIDGAHGPGMLDLDLQALGADFYTGNCHKWICTPKGVALLYVDERHRESIRPVAISHGASAPTTRRSRFLMEFDWVGTNDPTAMLTLPSALAWMERQLPGGWPEIRKRNRALALAARDLLIEALGIDAPAPDSMIGSLAAVPIPDGSGEIPPSPLYMDPLQDTLLERWNVEVPVVPWPAPPKRLLRVSAQLYNRIEHYETLSSALRELFPR